MQLISKYNNSVKISLNIIDIYRKYTRAVLLKDRTDITITTSFKHFLNESGRKPNEIWVDQGGEFCNRLMKLWLHGSSIEMYSSCNEGKFIVPERFIRNLKTGLKNVYTDKLDEIVS